MARKKRPRATPAARREYEQAKYLMARNIRRLRKACGLTQEQLAEEAGIHVKHIQRLEQAEPNVTLLTICALAVALKVRWDDLICDE